MERGQIVGRGKNRQILVTEQQTNARLISKLQTIGCEILAFRLR